MAMDEGDRIGKILQKSKTVAVVGCSRDPEKPANFVPKYLKQNGYRIIPVNPSAEEILGEKCYPSLLDVPDEIDIVDIFRPGDQVEPVIDAAIKKKVKVVWMQEGIVNERVAEKARTAGLEVVMDRCMMKEHEILFGGDKMRLNNVDMAKAGAFLEEVKLDKSKAIKTKRVEGMWNFSGVQFIATLEHATGKTVFEADGPPFMGGSGMKPDPVQYCLFGLAACYAQTFASIAAEKGIELKLLKVSVENKVNLSKPLGLGDEPAVEKVNLSVVASGSGDLKEIEQLAKERCPGVYCLTNPIKLEITSKFE